MDNFETEVPGKLTLMEAESLACACGILGFVEQKKQNKNKRKITSNVI